MPESSRIPTAPVQETAPKEAEEKAKAPSVMHRLFVNDYGVLFLGSIALFLIAGFVVLRPPLNALKTLRADAAGLQVQLEDERAYLESLKRSTEAAQRIPEETLADVEEALPSEAGIPKLLETLSRIAVSQNVRLSSIQFSAPREDVAVGQPSTTKGTPVQFVDISMNLGSPNYATTRRYLDALERNLRLFDIQNIAVAPGQGEADQVYSIQMRAYLLSPASRP
jgi:hypothetical protein